MHTPPPRPPSSFFFFNDPAPTEIYTLSLHDALPISFFGRAAPEIVKIPFHVAQDNQIEQPVIIQVPPCRAGGPAAAVEPDRKSTRLNSSHSQISYAVFCLKKNKRRQR